MGILARQGNQTRPAYLDRDIRLCHSARGAENIPQVELLLWLDEIHKRNRRRTLLKSIHNIEKPWRNIILEGSASFDCCRKGGDSMIERYR